MNQDPEIDRLVAAFIDGTLSEGDRASFEKQVRENPQALARVAEAVRFEVELSDAANPDQLELVEQRRTVIDRTTGRSILVESSQRLGPVGPLESPAKRISARRWRWMALIAAVGSAGLIAWWLAGRTYQVPTAVPLKAPSTGWELLPLKNPGFESPALGREPASSFDLAEWQEKFKTHNAKLIAIPQGGAHGGYQVAALAPGGHIKQSLFDSSGAPLVFQPGIKVRVSGWVAPTGPMEARVDGLIFALHYIDDELRQYVVVYRILGVDGGGWRHFSVELEVPEQDYFEPSYYTKETNPTASVRGRPILLSITNTTSFMLVKQTFSLDDLKVEVLRN